MVLLPVPRPRLARRVQAVGGGRVGDVTIAAARAARAAAVGLEAIV